MIQHKNNIIAGSKTKPILLDVYFLEDGNAKPLLIFSHGFKGFKDWGHFDLMAQQFAEAGFVCVKFNFSHNGTSPENPTEFVDLEAFGNNNYTLELDDLKRVMDWCLNASLLKSKIAPNKLYLLGHSRGGAISILKAGEDKRVKKLVTWAAVSNIINRNKQRTIETWKKEGVVYAKNVRTQQDMPLYYQFYENQQANRERLNVLRAVKRLEIPFLIIHGTADEAVKYSDAEELHTSAKQAILFPVDGANHTFGVRHPFSAAQLPAHAAQVIERTIRFLKE